MAEIEVLNLSDLSRSFASRAKGKEVARLLGDAIAISKPEAVVVGWNGVRAASPAFIDEFVNGIHEILQTEFSCTRILFTGDDSGVINLVDVILKRRESPIRLAVGPDYPELATLSNFPWDAST